MPNPYTPSGRVRLNLEGIRALKANVRQTVRQAGLNTAFRVRDDAQEIAEKDTSFMAKSIHVVTSNYSEYSLAKSLATSEHAKALSAGRTPKGVKIGRGSRYLFFPEIRPTNPEEVWVVVGAMHGIANEEAVGGRKPFLGPALRKNRTTYTKEIKTAFNGLSVRAVLSKQRKEG